MALAAKDDGAELAELAASFVATSDDPLIRNSAGDVIFDLTSYDFLADAAPASVNPSLWRHARILTQHGLYRLSERIYQVRGFDLSIVTFIDSGDGWIVIDPLTVVESARKAKELVCHPGATPHSSPDLLPLPRGPFRWCAGHGLPGGGGPG